jgi:hypothetical protein
MATTETWIAIQSGGYFGDACVAKGYMKSTDSAVIGYKQFMEFMNGSQVTMPVFVSPDYAVCISVAKELNDSASVIELNNA